MYIQSFMIGGLLFTGIKYTSSNVENIKVASMIAAFPIGLLSSYMIPTLKLNNYVKAYIINLVIVLLTAPLFYILLKYTSRNKALILSILFWSILNIIYIFLI
jgi:hypothetical protein